MQILVIDAQGGGVGKQIVERIKEEFSEHEVIAVGTNTTATAAMIKAKADHAATGENAVVVGCRKADVIVGPIGIIIADAMYGEITPKMAVAVAQSNAKKILIPFNHCDHVVVGIQDLSTGRLIEQAMEELKKVL